MKISLSALSKWVARASPTLANALHLRSSSSDRGEKFIDLAPTDEADKSGVYAAALKFATDNPNVSNIALTGPYGSGKSSIIRSFLKFYPRKALHISLAAFLPEAGDEQRTVTKQEIERSILQQLLYGADADKLPLSRFKRIQSPGFWSFFRSLYILAGLLAFWHVFRNRDAIVDGAYFQPFGFTNWLDLSVITFALVFAWTVIHHFYVASFGVSLKSISLKDIEMRPSSDDQDSILNRHLDEIIYFFQATDYDLVVVEDLDRFDDSDIFVTLREINSLVNGNVGVKRQIRFLYALRDDMFANTDRTKFFEFIIPVIPIINSSNSIDMVIAQGRRLELDGRLDRQFLREVSRYLSDLRLIHNIFNEYAIYVENLEADGENVLDRTKLLAVLIYKNVYPRDFERLHRGEGHLAGIFGRKDHLIASREQGYRAEIVALERDIAASERQVAADVKDLRRIYAMALFEVLPPGVSGVGTQRNSNISPSDLCEREDFEEIISAPMLFFRFHNQVRQHDNSALQQNVNPDATYSERVRAVENKTDLYRSAVRQEIAALKAKVKAVRTSKFNALLQAVATESEGLFRELGDGGELARFLVLEGHLDDTYYHYTSLFHKGRLSPSDNKFLIQIRAFNTPEPDFPIDNPREVIAAMREDDFGLDYALNVRLIDALLEGTGNKDRLNKVLAFLANDFSSHQEFFETYYAVGSRVGDFLERFVGAWRGFVPAAMKSPDATLHVTRLVEHLSESQLARERKEHPSLGAFVADNLREILDQLGDVEPDKFEALQIEARELGAIADYPQIVRKLYELGHYRLNETNLDYIFDSIILDQEGASLRRCHYTRIRALEDQPIFERVERDFATYFHDVLLRMEDNDKEEVGAITAVLARDEIDPNDVETFVRRQTTQLPTLEVVPEKYQPLVFRAAKIAPNWASCLAFILSDAFDNDALIAFLNDDEVRATLLEEAIPDTKDAFPLREYLIKAGEFDDEVYRSYVQRLPMPFKKFPDGVSAHKQHILIDEQRVVFNIKNLAMLCDDVDLQTIFIAKNISSYLDDHSSYPVEDDLRERLLAADISIEQKRAILNLMELNELPSAPKRAGAVGPILLQSNDGLPSLTPDAARAIILNSTPLRAQVQLLTLLQDMLDNDEVREVLAQLPEPYRKIQTGWAQPRLKRTTENIELVQWLETRRIISSVREATFTDNIIIYLFRS